MTALLRQNSESAFDRGAAQAFAVLGILLLTLSLSHSHFLQATTAGLLSSRSNPFRTQTVTDRDGAGRILTQTVNAGSTTPLSETQAWLDDGRLDTYSAVRDGANAWNESRDYGYDARGQVLSESYAPGAETTATLTYTFSTNKLGIRTGAQVGAGGNTNWFVNASTVNSLARVTQFSDNTGTRTVPTSGASFGAASVKLEVDGVPGPSATHPGWQDATGSWTADLQLTPGLHTLTARGVHPSGWLSDPATSTFTVTGTPQTMTPAFDGMGNVTSRTWSGGKVQTLTWDAFGRLTKVVQTGVDPFIWTAAFDGLGRRLRTTHTPDGGSAFVVNSSFDPQAEFLEVGVNINGAQNWRVNGPDLNGSFGALNGTGGLEAVISPTGTTGTINDAFGNVVASVGANSTVTWSPVKVGSYGPLPQYETKTLEGGASLVEASTWRTRRADPTGLVNMGARHWGQKEGQFVSADPLGHGSSWSLYSYADGDGVNNFDADGRLASQTAKAVEGIYSAINPAYAEARDIDRLRAALGVENYTPANAASQVRQADADYAANWESAYLSGTDTQAATSQYERSRNNALTGYGEALQHVDALNQPAYDTLVLGGIVLTAGLGETANPVRTTPNPGGKLGDALTRQTTQNVIRDAQATGFTDIQTEVLFQRGAMAAKNRFVDIVATNPETSESLIINIGKKTKSGMPIIRERQALDDIIFSPTMQQYPDSQILFIQKGADGLP